MWLTKPMQEKDDIEKALKVVQEEADQETLLEIAKNAHMVEVRNAAIQRIVDPKLLGEIVKNCNTNGVDGLLSVFSALWRIDDLSVLDEVIGYLGTKRRSFAGELTFFSSDEEAVYNEAVRFKAQNEW